MVFYVVFNIFPTYMYNENIYNTPHMQIIKKWECSRKKKKQDINGAVLRQKELNPLPDGKILDWCKLKKIADDTLKRV